MTLILAIIIGLGFGFALNRVGATNPENIINMLRLTDLRLMKTILFAIGFSSILLFLGMNIGLIDMGHLSVKAANLGVVIGGGILGLGFAIAGFCPGTGLASAAAGHKDALVFIVGGLVGAFAYMLGFDTIKENTELLTNVLGGKTTLAITGSAKFPALIDTVPGLALAVGLGILMIAIAKNLPPRDCGSCCIFKGKK